LRPEAEVVVQNLASQPILDLVLRRQADLGIVTRPPWLDPALWSRTILVEPMRWAAWRKHRLAGKGDAPVSVADLAGEAAVVLAKGAETRSLVDRGLRSLGAKVHVVMESGNLEVVKAYVALGLGISFLPEMALTPKDRQRLAVRPMPEGFPQRKIAVVRRKDRTPTLLAMDLLRLLSEHFRGVPEEGP
jgi:DNA-binding transcriptional LysR family regulator